MICEHCTGKLRDFREFRLEVFSARQRLKSDTLDESIYIDPSSVETGETQHVAMSQNRLETLASTDKISFIQETSPLIRINSDETKRKPTKLIGLLKKHKVKFVEDDIRKAMKARKVVCPYCEKICTSLHWPVHLISHEGGREHKFLCEVCSRLCVSNAELIVHQR